MAGASFGVVVVLGGWVDGATSAGSYQGLACRRFLLPTCMYALMPTRPGVGVLYSREVSIVWHLQACVMRRRSTGEDERKRDGEDDWKSTCMCMHCFVYGSKSFIRTYACVIGSNQCNEPKQKNAPRNPFSSNIATVSDGY